MSSETHSTPQVFADRPVRPVLVVEPAVLPPAAVTPSVLIFSHSRLFYWWPAWVVGYILAGLTYLHGAAYPMERGQAIILPSSNPGVLFLLTLFLVLLITNVTVRGLASVVVILCIALGTVLMAYYGVWDEFLAWFGDLRIYLNLGAYFWFSTALLVLWLTAFLIFDRLSYWRVTPGQVTRHFVLGGASQSLDTDNMVLEKLRDDAFRHWLLGFGSGDLSIRPYGARQDPVLIPNVLRLGSRMRLIERLLATEPGSLRPSAPV